MKCIKGDFEKAYQILRAEDTKQEIRVDTKRPNVIPTNSIKQTLQCFGKNASKA